MTKAHRLLTRKPSTPVKGVPINFLLGCSNDDLGNYEIMRLAAAADLRKQVQELQDQINEQMGLAWLAAVRFCTKHLAIMRARDSKRRGLKGEPGSRVYLYGEIPESTHGRQPGTLASLAMNREKATRALCAELGISPDSAAVSLNAAVEALQKIMPHSQAEAMTQKDLFEKAGVITLETGRKALKRLLAEDKIERIGRGIKGDLFRYWLSEAP